MVTRKTVKRLFQRDIENTAIPNFLSAKQSTGAVSIVSRVRTDTGVSEDYSTVPYSAGSSSLLGLLDSEEEEE
jgi:hypothetical protein